MSDFGKAGEFKCSVKTVSNWNGNVTKGVGFIKIDLDGKVSGTIDYSNGDSYNEDSAAPIEGWRVGENHPDTGLWT